MVRSTHLRNGAGAVKTRLDPGRGVRVLFHVEPQTCSEPEASCSRGTHSADMPRRQLPTSLLYVCLGAQVLACVPAQRRVDTRALFGSLRLGMHEKDVKRLAQGYETIDVLVSPSNAAPGARLTLARGIIVTVVFDEERRVAVISTRDDRIRTARGLGPGQSRGQLLTNCSKIDCYRYLGYGIICIWTDHRNGVRVLFCFDDVEERTLSNDSKIIWIELRRVLRDGLDPLRI